MNIEWSPLAIEDREHIFDYIEQRNPYAALTTDQRIVDQLALLSSHPKAGRPGRISITRELTTQTLLPSTEF